MVEQRPANGRSAAPPMRRQSLISRKALVLAGALAESPAQRLLRLRLQIANGQALIHARGFAAPETAAAFSRAREFASGVEDVTERFPVYYGLWAGSWVRGEFAQMREPALGVSG